MSKSGALPDLLATDNVWEAAVGGVDVRGGRVVLASQVAGDAVGLHLVRVGVLHASVLEKTTFPPRVTSSFDPHYVPPSDREILGPNRQKQQRSHANSASRASSPSLSVTTREPLRRREAGARGFASQRIAVSAVGLSSAKWRAAVARKTSIQKTVVPELAFGALV